MPFITSENFSLRQVADSKFDLNHEMEMLELMVLPGSYYLNKPANKIFMREQRHISIVAIHRKGEDLKGNLDNIRLKTGDMLICLLYTSPSPRDRTRSRMPSSA